MYRENVRIHYSSGSQIVGWGPLGGLGHMTEGHVTARVFVAVVILVGKCRRGADVLSSDDPDSFSGDTTNKIGFHGDLTFRQTESLGLKNRENILQGRKEKQATLQIQTKQSLVLATINHHNLSHGNMMTHMLLLDSQ